jgi:hypothetical protein
VIASVGPLVSHGGGPRVGSTVSIVGPIRASPHVPDERVHEFWIGDPANLMGGHLRLTEAAFRDATLTTLDGNDYFIVRIMLEGLEILLQDENSGAP